MKRQDMLIPQVGVITQIRQETPDVKTFRVEAVGGGKCFAHMPGQCAMLSVPGVGEAMFSITSSPTIEEYQEFSIKKCGCLTEWLHSLEVGEQLAIRGPLGNHFPVESSLLHQDLLFIAGGIGIAPLHSVINYCLDHRKDYGTIEVIYGARSSSDLVDLQEMQQIWRAAPGVRLYLTIDRAEQGWNGHVGFVPDYVKELKRREKPASRESASERAASDSAASRRLARETSASGEALAGQTVLMCGPPVMIKFTLAALKELGYQPQQIYTTMELRMKCGIGKCGRCNIGSKYVCKDGPVFRFDELDELPEEY